MRDRRRAVLRPRLVLPRRDREQAGGSGPAAGARPGAALPRLGGCHRVGARHRRPDHPDQPQGLRAPRLDRGRAARAKLDRHLPSRAVRPSVAENFQNLLVRRPLAGREPSPHAGRPRTADRVAQPGAVGRRRATSPAPSARAPTSPSGTRRSRPCERRKSACGSPWRAPMSGSGTSTTRSDPCTGPRRCEAQFGLRPGTFAGTFEAYLSSSTRTIGATLLATIEQASESGNDFRVDHRAVAARRDGAVALRRGPLPPRESGGSVRGVGISMDVTERRNLEDQYHQAQKMEAIGRAGRRRGARLQQPADRDPRLQRAVAVLPRSRRSAPARDMEEIQKAGDRAAAL